MSARGARAAAGDAGGRISQQQVTQRVGISCGCVPPKPGQAQANTLKLTAGPQFNVPIIASTGLAAGTVAVIESASFVSGFSSTPEFRVGDQAAYHAEDTAPADPIMAGQPVKSLWQTHSIGMKMDLFAAWGLRAAGHAQWLSGATW